MSDRPDTSIKKLDKWLNEEKKGEKKTAKNAEKCRERMQKKYKTCRWRDRYLILFKFRLPLIFASRGAKIGMDEKLGLKIKGRREGGDI